MPEQDRELTQAEIKEAIKKNHCPYCKNQKFVGVFHAYQVFDFSSPDISKKPTYLELDLSDSENDMDSKAKDFREVWCDACKKTTPAEIWSEWKL